MKKIVTIPIQIRFADVDMAHHVHNGVYLHWFELARMAFHDRFIPRDHDWTEQGLILARNEVDYRVPVRLHYTLEADAWCSAIGTKSFDLRYAIRRIDGESSVICAEGRSVMVCFNYRKACTVPLPEPWRAALEQLLLPA
jgi:acyl-CoA thioester hydrolase